MIPKRLLLPQASDHLCYRSCTGTLRFRFHPFLGVQCENHAVSTKIACFGRSEPRSSVSARTKPRDAHPQRQVIF